VLYAVWAAEMEATPCIRTLMHRAHWRVAQRVIRVYRTTSYAVVTALGDIPAGAPGEYGCVPKCADSTDSTTTETIIF